MIIGLHDADAEHIKHKSFPNYALMKISAWHKQQGDTVEWWMPLNHYDKVYSSKIFDFTPINPYLPDNTIKGGTGYDIKSELPTWIDEMFPDYSLYPECDYAIGFLTRGCPNNCEWCYVPQKEGKIKPYRLWQELIRKDSNKVVLMDNNILACEHGVNQLRGLADSGIEIDLNQGMDIRLVTEDTVKLFKELKWIKYIRFSCDTKGQLPYFKKVLRWFEKYGVSRSKVFIYILVRKDIEDAEYRVRELHNMFKSLNLYAQAERNEGKGIIPNKAQLEFAQRYVYGRGYRKETWSQYCSRPGCRLVV
ncbi:MAG: radical SAM protein [Muricomes sp.]